MYQLTDIVALVYDCGVEARDRDTVMLGKIDVRKSLIISGFEYSELDHFVSEQAGAERIAYQLGTVGKPELLHRAMAVGLHRLR